MNDLALFGKDEDKWYTIEELSSMCGLQVGSCKNILTELWKSFPNDNQKSRVVNIGGHRNIRQYSEDVLKALKQYQLVKSAPNALKDKETAITGNVSFVAKEAQSQTIAAILNNPQALLELAMQSSRKLLEVSEENKTLRTTNSLLMHTVKTYTASEIAKELGISSAKKLNLILEEKGIQYKRNGTRIPTAKYSECGYYEIKQEVLENGAVVYNSHITQKGRDFMLNLFGKEVK